jgi:large subunit ribosomal protein L21
MYAIIETGGKQYRVEKDDIIDVELIDTTQDGKVEFKNVLFINDGASVKMGAPYLSQYTVKAELISEIKAPKVVSFKYKKRKGYRRKVGHRQRYSKLKITDITG